MCGVFGVGLNDPTLLSDLALEDLIHQATFSLASRGPEGEGMWIRSQCDGGLGHRRLSFFNTTTNSHQPHADPDGQWVGVVNGELYDHQAWRSRLESQGVDINGDDCAVLLACIKRFGVTCLGKMSFEGVGIFWDLQNNTVLMFRDRFGIKPLVYHVSQWGWMAGSEAKSLFATQFVRPQWDRVALGEVIQQQYIHPERTLFDQIKKVAPGGWVVLKKDPTWHVYEKGVWDKGEWSEQSSLELVSPQQAAQDLWSALDVAVGRRSHNTDGSLGVHVSGGIDSGAVACLATKRHSNLKAFTVTFPEIDVGAYNEKQWAQATADHLGIPWIEVPLLRFEAWTMWEKAVVHSESVAINSHLSGKWILNSAIRSHGCKAALTGEGADEMLLGYAHLRHDYNQMLNKKTVLSDNVMLSSSMFDPSTSQGPSAWAAKRKTGDLLKNFLRMDALGVSLDPSQWGLSSLSHHPIHQHAKWWNQHALSGYILSVLGDGMESGHGVEGRLPYLDTGVVDLVRTWHPDVVMRQEGKAPLRLAMRGKLPIELTQRPKHPFEAPPLLGCSRVRQACIELIEDNQTPALNTPYILSILHRIPREPELARIYEPVFGLLISLIHLAKNYQMPLAVSA
jgi:asparagine synthase (glutamine-hydrolysing)